MMTPKENLLEHIYGEKPEYVPMTLADIQVCGFLYPLEQPVKPGKDIFGVPWAVTREGAIPSPGYVAFDEVSDWKRHVVFPDLSLYDFQAFAEAEAQTFPQADRSEKLYTLMTACGLWERLIAFMGFDNALCALAEDPDGCQEFFEAMADFKIACANKLIDAYHPDIFLICDDVAYARGMFMEPKLYRKILKPAYKRIVEAISSRGIIFQMHCCGKCEEVVPDFIDIGAKMWHSAQRMNNLPKLLEQYKGKLVIEGGWDTAGPASRIDADEETIRAEVRRCMTEYKKPGFVLCASLFNEKGNGFIIGDPRTEYIFDEWNKYKFF